MLFNYRMATRLLLHPVSQGNSWAIFKSCSHTRYFPRTSCNQNCFQINFYVLDNSPIICRKVAGSVCRYSHGAEECRIWSNICTKRAPSSSMSSRNARLHVLGPQKRRARSWRTLSTLAEPFALQQEVQSEALLPVTGRARSNHSNLQQHSTVGLSWCCITLCRNLTPA